MYFLFKLYFFNNDINGLYLVLNGRIISEKLICKTVEDNCPFQILGTVSEFGLNK